MMLMLLAPPKVPEYLLWILMYGWFWGSRSPKLVTSFSWEAPVGKHRGDQNDDDGDRVAVVDELVAEPVQQSFIFGNVVVEGHAILLALSPALSQRGDPGLAAVLGV